MTESFSLSLLRRLVATDSEILVGFASEYNRNYCRELLGVTGRERKLLIEWFKPDKEIPDVTRMGGITFDTIFVDSRLDDYSKEYLHSRLRSTDKTKTLRYIQFDSENFF